jgi:excisionase family DNA binding protein
MEKVRATDKGPERLLDIDEAAELLRRSHWTIRKDLRSGVIRSVRLGRRILFEPRELRRVVAAARKKAEDKASSPKERLKLRSMGRGSIPQELAHKES